ncbi:DUF7146 domain-containing protein (plasmid) [Cupriavidus basilensis]
MSLNFKEVDWVKVLTRAQLDVSYLTKRQGPCPLCGGKTRFRFDNKDDAGTYFCNHCGAGNGYTLLRAFTGMSDREALAFLEGETCCRQVGRPAARNDERCVKALAEAEARKAGKKRGKLNEAWSGSETITQASPVWIYLNRRVPGLQFSWLAPDLRYHPSMAYWDTDTGKPVNKGDWPVMLARARRSSGVPVTLHRTYLSADGYKAPFAKVKKQMESAEKLAGAAIRLNRPTKPSRKLIVCEGIETGLALVAATVNRIEVWCLLNAGNLAVADIPRDRFDEVIICADRDPLDPKHGWRPGEHFAEQLQARLVTEGFAVRLHVPKTEGMDYSDLWLKAAHLRLAA